MTQPLPRPKSYPPFDFVHTVLYCRPSHEQLVDALNICADAVEALSPNPVCNDYFVLANSARALPLPWEFSDAPIDNRDQWVLTSPKKYQGPLHQPIRCLSPSSLFVSHLRFQHNSRYPRWQNFARDWQISIERATLVGKQSDEVSFRLSLRADRTHDFAAVDERVSDLPQHFTQLLARLTESLNAYHGFIDCTYFAFDCGGSSYDYQPQQIGLTSTTEYIAHHRWYEAGPARFGKVRGTHWASLLSNDILNRLGGRAGFRDEFLHQVKSNNLYDGNLYVVECHQGLVIKLAEAFIHRIVRHDHGLAILPLTLWLDKRLRAANLLI